MAYVKKYIDKVIVCVAGGNQASDFSMEMFEDQCRGVKYVGANNLELHQAYSLRFPRKTVVTLSHGVDINKFKRGTQKERRFTVGWVGNPLSILKRMDVARNICINMGCDLKAAHDLTHDEMRDFYNSIDCLLVTSEFESHPLPVYEAMSCMIPVISTDVGDVSHTIISGVNGFILPVDADESEFIKKIQLIKDNPSNIKYKMGLAARQTIVQNWRWSSIVKQYEGLAALVNKRVEPEQVDLDTSKAGTVWDSENIPAWITNLKLVDPDYDIHLPLYKHFFLCYPRAEAIQKVFDLHRLDPPRITLIIPTYDRAWCIGTAIDSILAEGYPNLELIVCDSRSKGMKKVMKKYEDNEHVRYVNIERNPDDNNDGGRKTNHAMDIATGDYFTFLGDDDTHADGSLTIRALYMELNPDVYAVFSDYDIYSVRNNHTINNSYAGKIVDFNSMLKGNYIGGGTILIPNDGTIRFDPDDSYGDDYDRWIYIMAKHGWKHLPIVSETVIVDHQEDRMGDIALKNNTMNERYLYHKDLAMREYSKLRAKNKNDLHIAVFSFSYGRKPYGGSANNHWNVVDALTTQGYDVTAVTDKPDEVYYKNKAHPHNIISWEEFINMDVKNRWNVFHVFGGLNYIKWLNEHGIKPIAGSNLVTNCGLKELVPYADTYVDSVEKWETIRASDEATMHKYDCALWIAQSEFQELCYRDICKFKGEVHLFPNTVDCQNTFTYIPMEYRPNKILWTGSRAKGKGWEVFEKLAKQMPDVEFIAMSETEIPFTAPNIKPIFKSGMDAMPKLYAQGSILLTTTHCENQPLGVIEGGAMGLPVVAFAPLKTPHGIVEVIEDKKNGYLVPWMDTDAMEKVLRKLLKSEKLRSKMGKYSREYYVKTFDYPNAVKRFQEVYSRYLDKVME